MLAVHREVVYTPAYILGPGAEAVTPPGILAGGLVENPEGIDKSGLDKGVHPVPFLGGETGIGGVFGGVRQVDFLMGDIVIAADDNAFLPGQILGKVQESAVEPELEVQPFQAVGAVGEIACHKEEGREFQGQDPAFAVEFGIAQSLQDTHRLHAGIDRHS